MSPFRHQKVVFICFPYHWMNPFKRYSQTCMYEGPQCYLTICMLYVDWQSYLKWDFRSLGLDIWVSLCFYVVWESLSQVGLYIFYVDWENIEIKSMSTGRLSWTHIVPCPLIFDDFTYTLPPFCHSVPFLVRHNFSILPHHQIILICLFFNSKLTHHLLFHTSLHLMTIAFLWNTFLDWLDESVWILWTNVTSVWDCITILYVVYLHHFVLMIKCLEKQK